MKSVLPGIVLTACLASLSASSATAQEDQPVNAEGVFVESSYLALLMQTQTETNRDLELAEDMEIMGRLLEETLEAIYRHPKIGPQGSSIFQDEDNGIVIWDLMGDKATDSASSGVVRAPLSSYLESFGIVFQSEAPSFLKHDGSLDGEAEDAAGSYSKPSRWDQMRMRVHGQAEQAPMIAHGQWMTIQGCRKCHSHLSKTHLALGSSAHNRLLRLPPTKSQLVESLIDVLAENGHNVRHLNPEERVTVALTFRLDENADAATLREKQGDPFTAKVSPYVELLRARGVKVDSAKQGAPQLGGSPGGSAEPLSGDLLLNTHQYDRAIAAYQKALKDVGVNDLFQHSPDTAQRGIYQNLIQAHVGAGNLEDAQKLLATLLRMAEVKATPVEQSPPPLPSRLVVSATKAQLDQVAGGEMSREEFAKQAKVQFLEGRGTEPSKQAKDDWKSLIDPKTGGILYDRAKIELAQPPVRP